jgi:F-type H+-transporting ATPase subunit b
MLIDPITVIAQVVNFVILLVALKLLLFDRVMRAVDEREAAIAARIRGADERFESAEAQAAELDRRLEELDRTRADLLAQARDEAQARHDALLTAARDDVATRQDRWQQAMVRERDRTVEQLRWEVGAQVVGLTEQVLADLADTSLELATVGAFLRRLDRHDGPDGLPLRAWLGDGDGRCVIVSAFQLPDDTRAQILGALASEAGRELSAEFEVDPELVCGLEVRVCGRAVAWAVHDYLGRFEETMRSLLAGSTGRTDGQTEGR